MSKRAKLLECPKQTAQREVQMLITNAHEVVNPNPFSSHHTWPLNFFFLKKKSQRGKKTKDKQLATPTCPLTQTQDRCHPELIQK